MNVLVPVSWLKDFLKTDAAGKTIADLLSLCGPSVERCQKAGRDMVFDVEVTTNRPDAASIFGLAREAAAILAYHGHKAKLVDPSGQNLPLQPDTGDLLTLDVSLDPKLCPRFTAIILDGVKIKPSPALLKNRLEAVGIRSINNIVDITNYLMVELGQPMHAFDYDKIKDHQMSLRQSKAGEKITTLDEKLHKLPAGAIVIEDKERLIDLCGIMGGANSQITKRTKRVLLFVQAYDALSIRKTTQALGFRTEAATRFEKGIDLSGILPALSRAVYLAKKYAGAKIASELIDITNFKEETSQITLPIQKLGSYLGVQIPPQQAAKILGSLGFAATAATNQITATPPSWRAADVTTPEDLIEEIARIYGYHNLPSKLPEGQIPPSQTSDLEQVIELKKFLKAQGLTETMTYSLVAEELITLIGQKTPGTVELNNPLTREWQFLRPTIIPSLVQVIAQNKHLFENIKIFEIAKTYLTKTDDIPTQDLMLTVVTKDGDFRKIKGLVENIFAYLRREVSFQTPQNTSSLFAKGLCAQIHTEDQPIGMLGIVSPHITSFFGLDSPVTACEINLTVTYQLSPVTSLYHPLPKYPPVIEDLSAIFNQNIPVAQIASEAKNTGGELLASVQITDVFQDTKIGRGKKSVTLHLIYQKKENTPTPEEVDSTRQKIIRALEKTLGGKIRN